MTLVDERGLTYINGYDHPDIIAGAGTIGLEMIEQVPDLDAIVVPVGGAGQTDGGRSVCRASRWGSRVSRGPPVGSLGKLGRHGILNVSKISEREHDGAYGPCEPPAPGPRPRASGYKSIASSE
ncbi:MAG: pyridoxal-phosphate dependent enzyme [Nannocystaceae bacterium]